MIIKKIRVTRSVIDRKPPYKAHRDVKDFKSTGGFTKTSIKKVYMFAYDNEETMVSTFPEYLIASLKEKGYFIDKYTSSYNETVMIRIEALERED